MSIYLGTTKISGAYTIAKNIGEVFYSQSSSAADNPGGLPLFTGEMISNADQLYPQFYNWLLSHPELCTTNSAYETSITNWGKCSYYVVDGTNKTIKLPKIARQDSYIIYSYHNEMSWYRIYSDGFCEQGGRISSADGSSTEIPLLISYIDVNYSVSGMQYEINGSTQYRNGWAVQTLTTSSFTLENRSNNTNSFMWVARGYVDISNYQKNPLYPWVFAYNTAISASMAQAAQFQAALSSKVDTDLNNIDPSFASNLISSAIIGMMPNYAQGIAMQKGTQYTADVNGWVSVRAGVPNTGPNVTLVVNGETVFNYSNGYDAVTTVDIMRPIAKGDIWEVGGSIGNITVKFYPCKAESQISE